MLKLIDLHLLMLKLIGLQILMLKRFGLQILMLKRFGLLILMRLLRPKHYFSLKPSGWRSSMPIGYCARK